MPAVIAPPPLQPPDSSNALVSWLHRPLEADLNTHTSESHWLLLAAAVVIISSLLAAVLCVGTSRRMSGRQSVSSPLSFSLPSDEKHKNKIKTRMLAEGPKPHSKSDQQLPYDKQANVEENQTLNKPLSGTFTALPSPPPSLSHSIPYTPQKRLRLRVYHLRDRWPPSADNNIHSVQTVQTVQSTMEESAPAPGISDKAGVSSSSSSDPSSTSSTSAIAYSGIGSVSTSDIYAGTPAAVPATPLPSAPFSPCSPCSPFSSFSPFAPLSPSSYTEPTAQTAAAGQHRQQQQQLFARPPPLPLSTSSIAFGREMESPEMLVRPSSFAPFSASSPASSSLPSADEVDAQMSFIHQPNPDYSSDVELDSPAAAEEPSPPSPAMRRSDRTNDPQSTPSPVGPDMGVQGEIMSVLNDDGAGWSRHTRVYGGGVCLACLAAESSGSPLDDDSIGSYGDNVPLEDRR